MDSPAQFALSVIPAALLLATVATWPLWPVGLKEIPATAFSTGLSLLLILAAVVAEYGAGVSTILGHGPGVLIASLAVCYGTGLFFFSRSKHVRLWRLALFGTLWLVPGYILAIYTLMSSVCGFQSAGC